MADSKLADLTAITTPATTDILYLVHDPAGTPVDRKITVANLLGASAPAIKTSKPAANITRSGTTLGSFSTPWTVTVTAAAGQVVVVEACVAGSNSTDSITWLALAKGGTVLTKAAKTYAGGEPRTSFTTIRWVDESPSVGSNTYEVYGASGSTLTVMGGNTLDTSTSLTMNGNSVLTAQVMAVAS